MVKYYYVADAFNGVRLRPVHRSLKKAQERCSVLNGQHPGRYQVGDWVLDRKYENKPYEWPWEEKGG